MKKILLPLLLNTHPMGGMMIRGNVNDEAIFSVDITQSFFVNGIGKGEGFPELKEECRERRCDY